MKVNDNWDTDWLRRFTSEPSHSWMCFTSPCGVRVIVTGSGLEPTLLLMHINGFQDAVRGVLSSGAGNDVADVRCLADFYARYGFFDRLVVLLDKYPSACHYLSGQFRAGGEVLDLDLGRTKHGDRLALTGDMARSALAAQAARRALEGM